MCKYCQLKESSYKSGTRRGYYTLSHELLIKNSKLIVRANVNRRTSVDEYYESWGLDCDGERTSRETVFNIRFCPFCGRKLDVEYKPKIFLYINDKEKAIAFCEKNGWLIHEFDCTRQQRKDTSDNSYYLSLKIFDIINNSIKKDKAGLSLKDTMYLYSDKPKQYEFNEVKSFLSEGYDVFIDMDAKYKFNEYVIGKLHKMKYDIIPISTENIRPNPQKYLLDIVINDEHIIKDE